MTEPKSSKPAPAEVWITGIGLATSLGEGLDAHWDALNAQRINVDEKSFAPYIVHPLGADQASTRRSRKRATSARWKPGSASAPMPRGWRWIRPASKATRKSSARMDMIVAAGGGERDLAVDSGDSQRLGQGQLRARLSQRTADERSAADAVSGAALQPARRQHRHRPRRLRDRRAPSWARKPPASTRRGSRWRASPPARATSR